MSKAAYWQRGETLDYTNSGTTAIEANTITPLGNRVGVIGAPIAAGETGSLIVTGVFEMPKDDAAITAGADLYWDGTNGCVTATKGTLTVVAGYAAQAAAAADEVVLVKLIG